MYNQLVLHEPIDWNKLVLQFLLDGTFELGHFEPRTARYLFTPISHWES